MNQAQPKCVCQWSKQVVGLPQALSDYLAIRALPGTTQGHLRRLYALVVFLMANSPSLWHWTPGQAGDDLSRKSTDMRTIIAVLPAFVMHATQGTDVCLHSHTEIFSQEHSPWHPRPHW